MARSTFVSLAASAFLLLATTCSFVDEVQAGPYDDGNWVVKQWDIGRQVSPDLTFAPYHVRVWAPISCKLTCGSFDGSKFPVVLFVSGFAGQLDLNFYQEIMTGVAAQGIVVVGVDQSPGVKPTTTDYFVLAAELDPVQNYIQCTTGRCLASDLAAANATQPADTSSLVFLGHSSGVHTLMDRISLLLKRSGMKTCSEVGALIMLSPIDGQDPFGFGREYAITVGTALNYSLPALLVYGDLETKPGQTGGLGCAIAGLDAPRFYSAWRGQIYSIEASNIGHLDYLDPNSQTSYSSFCKTAAAADYLKKFRSSVKGMIVSFIVGTKTGSTPPINSLKNPTFVQFTSTYTDKKSTVASSSAAFGCTVSIVPGPLPMEIQNGIILAIVCFVTITFGGICTFVRRLDMDNRDDWLVKVDTEALQSPGPSFGMIPASMAPAQMNNMSIASRGTANDVDI